MMWGVDEDDGQLFSIGDYTDPLSTFTDYGKLQYQWKGKLKNVGKHIGAVAFGADNLLYMAVNTGVAGYREPVLMSFDIGSASSGSPSVVSFVGEINAGFNNYRDNITGLSFDPITGDMYALLRDNGSRVADHLLIIDPTTGNVLSDVGVMTGLDQIVGDGEDLVFDPYGNLYVTDNQDDHLYRVDPHTGSITGVLDTHEAGGLGVKRVKFEALAWDFMNDRLIAADDNHSLLAELTFGDGGNILHGNTISARLTDIEGIAFVPEPATLALVAFGAWQLFPRRQQSRL